MTRIWALATAAVVALTGAAGADDMIKVKSAASVPDTMAALTAAVEGAGATVFATVDHAAGAASVDLTLAPSQLLIFGNPKLGTPAMQDDPLAGVFLPLRVLVYEDSHGQVYLAYEEVDEMFDDLDIDDDAPYVKTMAGALKKLTAAAAGN
ncbi:DUF302 domain-containing protein [Pseudoruegeria sp. SK021]|uniref:DUF302 domain-containing protein n=1 Tax=Pseudoruegeria sp. SK021 TaxID=1933035 RepID=UPI000A23B620|nr:DUF302 domain-containing protein [Pseudoruegeria sp. SK021]OSP53689.1 camphor resistance protein CrcB [Pseudoruegeria sp. SK021]